MKGAVIALVVLLQLPQHVQHKFLIMKVTLKADSHSMRKWVTARA